MKLANILLWAISLGHTVLSSLQNKKFGNPGLAVLTPQIPSIVKTSMVYRDVFCIGMMCYYIFPPVCISVLTK